MAGRPTSSISTLMLVIALIAVLLGLFQAAPGLAALVFCALPLWGLAEAIAYPGRRRRGGRSMSDVEQTLWILCLLLVLPVVLIASLVAALFVVCGSMGSMEPGFSTSVSLVAGVGFVLLFFAILIAAIRYRNWRVKRKRSIPH